MSAGTLIQKARRRLRRILGVSSPAILMYHRIANETFDPWGLAVSPIKFREQLDWLKAHRTVLPLRRMVQLGRSNAIPANAIAITFDDGYACNLAAAQALREVAASSTVFVTVGNVRSGREFWWDELEQLILRTDKRRLRVPYSAGTIEVELGERQADDRHWPPSTRPQTRRQNAFHQLWSALRVLEPQQQDEALTQIRLQTNPEARVRTSHRPMSPAEVRSLPELDVEVGAHSLTHTSLPSRAEADQKLEIEGSRVQCSELSGSPVLSFAYPYGDFDEQSVRLVEEAGFTSACTTRHGAVRVSDEAFKLPRIQVGNWHPNQLARVLSLA